MDLVTREILSILDRCCDVYTFPILDNGYVYLAATRLSLFRSTQAWALVIEVFGFSPRAGLPDTHIYTFANCLQNRDTAHQYVSHEAYQRYLANNPNNESRFVYPIEAGPWQDPENSEVIALDAPPVILRGRPAQLPSLEQYTAHGIELETSPTVQVYEACRYFAATQRDSVLATEAERRFSIPPELEQILQLEDWNHPDVVDETVRPSDSETFQQLAAVLSTGNMQLYQPSLPPNTHWQNWPEGGQL
ncbi:MAG: hypothetical protein AAGF01_31335 [Cyanobacteria bacterium P01_G01_bin.38]